MDTLQPTAHPGLAGRRPGEGVMKAPEEKKWAKLLGFVPGGHKASQAWESTVGLSRELPSLELLIAHPWLADSSSGRRDHLRPKSFRFKFLPLLAL